MTTEVERPGRGRYERALERLRAKVQLTGTGRGHFQTLHSPARPDFFTAMAVEFITIVWRLSPYRAEKLLVQLAFADWANLDGEFHPTYREIAEKARITKPGAISIVQSMIEDKEIEMIARGGEGRGNRNRYRFAEKYLEAVRELSRRWSAKRAERVKQDDPSLRKRVKQDDPLRVKQDDPILRKRVNEDAKKGKPGSEHIKNNRHIPSCNATVTQQQQANDISGDDLPAAASPFNEAHSSAFAFDDVEAFVIETKKHIKNPGGLARIIWRSGVEDKAIERWKAERDRRLERQEHLERVLTESDDFDWDEHVSNLIARNDRTQLKNELEGIEERGGPKFDWEHRVIAYLTNTAASEAA